jgi:hypothetical protein
MRHNAVTRRYQIWIEMFSAYCQELRNACHILVSIFFRHIHKAVATVNFVMSVCETTWSNGGPITQICFLYYVGDFMKICIAFQFWLKSVENDRHFMWKSTFIFCSTSLSVTNIQVMWYLFINKIHVRSIPEHKSLWHIMCFEFN